MKDLVNCRHDALEFRRENRVEIGETIGFVECCRGDAYSRFSVFYGAVCINESVVVVFADELVENAVYFDWYDLIF